MASEYHGLYHRRGDVGFGKNVGLITGKKYFVEIVIGNPNIHFYGMLDSGTPKKNLR